jgi:hypothetical protein
VAVGEGIADEIEPGFSAWTAHRGPRYGIQHRCKILIPLAKTNTLIEMSSSRLHHIRLGFSRSYLPRKGYTFPSRVDTYRRKRLGGI